MNAQPPIDIAQYKEQNIFSIKDYLTLHSYYNTYVFDVRSRKEFCGGHLCGAINIGVSLPPIYPKDVTRLEKTLDQISIDKDQSLLIVYCKFGKRAGLAKRILEELGYSNVLSLGGIENEPMKSIMDNSDPRIPICHCNAEK